MTHDQLPAGLTLTTTDIAGRQPLLKMLVYGPSKAGKTYLAKTTGAPDQTLIVSAEPGLVTLKGVRLPVVQVETLAQVDALCGWLQQQAGRYRWLIVDSLSEIAEKCLEEELARPGRGGKKRHGQEAYGSMGSRMQPVVRRLRDMPMNVVMLAKQDDVEHAEGEGDRRRVWYTFRPLVPGNVLKKALPYMFDLVLALRVFDGQPDGQGRPTLERRLQTFPHQGFEAGDRSGVLEQYEPPDLAAIERKILGSAGPTQQPRRGDTP
jgi:hypothetical protein